MFVSCVRLFVAVCESGNCTSVFCRRYCRQLGHQTSIEVKGEDRGFQEKQTFKYGLTSLSAHKVIMNHKGNLKSMTVLCATVLVTHLCEHLFPGKTQKS